MTIEPAEVDNFEEERPAFSPEGVDLTLIRWMLSLTPEQRLEVAQNTANSIIELRKAFGTQ